MAVQEIGSYIRFGFKPIIFVINNGGYSIERAINGPEQEYNDVSMLWDHQKLLSTLGAREETGIQSRSFACRTVAELEKVLEDKNFAEAECVQVLLLPQRIIDIYTDLPIKLCEIFMSTSDYPWRLATQVAITQSKTR